MARRTNILTALSVRNANKRGLYSDGGGLYLQVMESGSKSWVFRYMLKGDARTMGLGPVSLYSLADARAMAIEARRKCKEGIDPIDERRARLNAGASNTLSFRKCAEAYVAAQEAGWRNEKHVAQWRSTLETYAGPVIGDLPVDQINLTHVLKIVEPIWTKKTETASRVRGRIEAVLDWAKVKGLRTGENPARWRGHLEALLPARTKVRKVKHHSAIDYRELPAFMKRLRFQQGTAARALEFLILTAARTNEVLGSTWSEINFEDALWTVPPTRMKAGREHRVPLSSAAVAILKSIPSERSGFVFQTTGGDGLSNAAMSALLKRMNEHEITVHGFRSTFRDWVAECTDYPRDLAEMALAHTIDSKVEAAYRRGDMLDRRRAIMNSWSAFCAPG